jgi:hypothetical protein
MPNVEKLLNELAVAVQKHSMYPTGHPALESVSTDLVFHLDDVLGETGPLTISVAKDRLIVAGEETKPGRALIDSLAGRLHNHQIAALHFAPGAEVDEVDAFLRELAVDAERRGRPIGLEPAESLPSWMHLRIEPVEYEALRLGEEETSRTVDESAPITLGAPVSKEEETGGEPDREPVLDREEIDEAAAALADIEFSPELLEIAAEIGELDADQAASARMANLLHDLPPEDLKRLLGSRDAAFAAKLVRHSTNQLNPRAAIDLIEAASASQTQPIGPWLLRLLTKLTHYAESSASESHPGSDEALREVVHELVDDWQLEDPRPAAYQNTLGQMAKSTAAQATTPAQERPYFADRLVMMGLELEMMGGMVAQALRDLCGTRLVELLGFLEAASERSQVADVMWGEVATQQTLTQVLEGDKPNFATVDRLLARIGVGAAEPLLDALQRTGRSNVRDEIVRRVSGLGPVIAGAVVARLDADRPEATAYLLSVLNELGTCPAGLSVAPFLEHSDPNVRGEAYRLAIRHERDLDQAILAALGESDTRLLAIGLAAAEQNAPSSAEPLLRQHATDRDLPVQLRVKAVRALSQCRTESALDALVRAATQRRWLLSRIIAPPSPVVVEALACIRERYRHLPRARDILEQAESSEDRKIRTAVGTPSPEAVT